MRNGFLASVAALSLLAVPATLSAQTDTGGQRDMRPAAPAGSSQTDMAQADKSFKMTPEQQQIYQSWSAEQRADYDSMSQEYQVYFWTLPPEQQSGYWALTPDQRGMIYKMSPDQRAKAWQAIAAQMNGQTPPTPPDQANPPGMGMPTSGVPAPQTAEQSVPPAMPADQGYQGGPYKGALTPPPASAMNKDYPVCTRKIQDSCRNRGGV